MGRATHYKVIETKGKVVTSNELPGMQEAVKQIRDNHESPVLKIFADMPALRQEV